MHYALVLHEELKVSCLDKLTENSLAAGDDFVPKYIRIYNVGLITGGVFFCASERLNMFGVSSSARAYAVLRLMF